MKKLPLLIACLIFSTFSYAQSKTNKAEPFAQKNAIHAMLGGHSLAYGVYYERMIVNHSRYKNSLMLGGMAYPTKFNLVPVWLPLTFNNLFSLNNKHHIELGAGATFIRNSYEAESEYQGFPTWQTNGAATIGYRYTAPNTPFVLRAAFTPTIEFANQYSCSCSGSFSIYPLGGFSVGYQF